MIRKVLTRLSQDRSGATAIEYGLVLALIVFGLFVATRGVGNQLRTTLGTASSSLSAGNAAG